MGPTPSRVVQLQIKRPYCKTVYKWVANYLISVHFQWEAGMSPAFIGGGWTNYAGIPCNHPITKSHYDQCFFFETTVDALYACSQLYRYLLEQ